MNIKEMMAHYQKTGLSRDLAAARVYQDIGVHKHFDIKQEEYCFDVCMDEIGASLLKNTVEQSFCEKLRSLLIFGSNSSRYKDIYDMYYLRTAADKEVLRHTIDILIFADPGMREHSMADILRRMKSTFNNKLYLNRAASSRQRWIDKDIHSITEAIMRYLQEL